MSETTNLTLPLIDDGSRQGRVNYNEAVTLLDHILYKAIVSMSVTAQPASPTEGAVYVIPAAATGTDWAGFAEDDLAYYTNGAWYNVTPKTGWGPFRCTADSLSYIYDGANWVLSASYYSGDHGLNSGLLDDDHTQYAIKTVTDHTRNLVSAGANSSGLQLSATGTLTSHQLVITDPTAALNEKSWGFQTYNSNTLDGVCFSDALNNFTPWLTVTRSGQTPGSVQFPYGTVLISEALQVGGAFQAVGTISALDDGASAGFRAGALGDVALYRYAADKWGTPDGFVLDSGNPVLQIYNNGVSDGHAILKLTTYSSDISWLIDHARTTRGLSIYHDNASARPFAIGNLANGGTSFSIDTGGKVSIPTSGSGGGLDISGRTLYEDASSYLHTNSTFIVDGFLGVGVAAPDANHVAHFLKAENAYAKLEATGTSDNVAWLLENTSGVVYLGLAGSTSWPMVGMAQGDFGINNTTGGKLYLSADSSSLAGVGITIQEDGYIGVGTTSPDAGLDVETANGATFAKFGSGISTYLVTESANYPSIGFNAYKDSNWKFGKSSAVATNYAGAFQYDSISNDLYWLYSSGKGNAESTPTWLTGIVFKNGGQLQLPVTGTGGGIDISGRTLYEDADGYLHTNGSLKLDGGIAAASTIQSSAQYAGFKWYYGSAATNEKAWSMRTNNDHKILAIQTEDDGFVGAVENGLEFHRSGTDITKAVFPAVKVGIYNTDPQTACHIGGALTLDEMADPSDPAEGDGVLWVSTAGELKYKTRQGGTVTAKTVATIP